MTHSPFTRVAALVGALALVLPLAARADDDELFASIYTENGFELRRDDRVFTLFVALNTAGFDRAEQVRALPFPKLVPHRMRKDLRQALSVAADKLAPPVEGFLDAHQQPLDLYVEAALAMGDAPEFTPGEGYPKQLAGLDKVLADFSRASKLPKLERSLSADFRAEFKRLRDVVDAPFAKLRAAYHLKEEEAPALVLVPNPFDAPSAAFARRAPDGTHVVVFGLSAAERPFDLQPALRAYSQLLASEAQVPQALDGFTEAVEQLKAQNVLPADATLASMLRASLKLAVESKLWAKDPQAETDAGFKKGLLLSRELLKAIGEPAESFPAEKGPFVAQVASRLDAKKALAELIKPATPGKK